MRALADPECVMGHGRIIDSTRANVGPVPDTRSPRGSLKPFRNPGLIAAPVSPHLERRAGEARATCPAIGQAVPHPAREDCGPAAGSRRNATYDSPPSPPALPPAHES